MPVTIPFRTAALAALCSFPVAWPVAAQEAPDPREAESAPAASDGTGPDERARRREIVVHGFGLDPTPAAPAYDSLEIGRAQILAAPSGRIEDVLGAVAGFQQYRRSDSRSSNPSAQGVTLRALGGNATSRALVTLDGVPMADPFFGYIPLSAIAPDRLGAVRVARGGGSGPFGAGALAGRIELESAGIAQLAPLSASLLANDRGETEASLGLARELGAGFVVADARWDRGKGFYTTPADQRVPATARAAFDSWSAALRGGAPLGEAVELQARMLVFRDDRTLRFDGADSSSEGQDASLRIVGRGAWQFEALGYVQARNFSNVVISSSRFTRVLDQRNTPSTGLGGKFELRPPVGRDHVLRLGLDYRRASGELQEEAYSAFSGALTERRRAGGTNSDLGLFAENDWTAAPGLVLTGGLRLDRTTVSDGFYRARDAAGAVVEETIAPDRADWTLGWRAGATYAADPRLRLRAAAYTGLRQPTLNELYRPFVVFPVVTQANAALDNERLEGFEAGIDLAPADGIEIALTAFDNRVEGAIANVTLAPNLRQRRNLPAIEARGVEGALAVTRGDLRLDATVAYTDAAVEGRGPSADLDGNRPAQTPRWAAGASLAWTPAPGWVLGASLRHVGAQFEDDRESEVLPAATTLGAYAQVPLTGRLALVLRGENLTGETVVTRNSGGNIDLGAPRTLWAGLRWGY